MTLQYSDITNYSIIVVIELLHDLCNTCYDFVIVVMGEMSGLDVAEYYKM